MRRDDIQLKSRHANRPDNVILRQWLVAGAGSGWADAWLEVVAQKESPEGSGVVMRKIQSPLWDLVSGGDLYIYLKAGDVFFDEVVVKEIGE